MKNTFQSEKSTQSVLSDASKNLLMNHLNSFRDNNLETLMSDYTNESVLITEEATYTGLEEIELFFVELISHFPKQKSSFYLDKIIVNGGLALLPGMQLLQRLTCPWAQILLFSKMVKSTSKHLLVN